MPNYNTKQYIDRLFIILSPGDSTITEQTKFATITDPASQLWLIRGSHVLGKSVCYNLGIILTVVCVIVSFLIMNVMLQYFVHKGE